MCVQNAGRSQMAAVLLHHHAQGRVHVRSAGSAPAGSDRVQIRVPGWAWSVNGELWQLDHFSDGHVVHSPNDSKEEALADRVGAPGRVS